MCNGRYPILQALIVCGFALFLAGCSANEVKSTGRGMDQIIHPDLPRPVDPYRFDWVVIEDQDKPYVALTFDDSLKFRQYLEDILRYIRDSNEVICYYREGQDDDICGEDNDN